MLESEDQVVKNKKLEAEIKNIHDQYKKLIVTYEDMSSFGINLNESGFAVTIIPSVGTKIL